MMWPILISLVLGVIIGVYAAALACAAGRRMEGHDD